MRTILGATTMLVAALSLAACAANDRRGYGYNRPARGWQGESRRNMGDRDRIYRGRDGRYYCKRNDGTTGAIAGALAGGLLGNVIAPGKSKTLGTVLGAGGGALAGRAIDRKNIRCE